jgi:hypothetical protein
MPPDVQFALGHDLNSRDVGLHGVDFDFSQRERRLYSDLGYFNGYLRLGIQPSPTAGAFEV